MKNKIPRKLKALKKDLELQIDYLIGYRPQGLHWKQESHLRQKMIDEALVSDYFPDEVREKLNTILDTLHIMDKEEQGQPYYGETNYEIKRKIKLRDWRTGETTLI